jgi:tetratricopeptide (TPR) repeat protein
MIDPMSGASFVPRFLPGRAGRTRGQRTIGLRRGHIMGFRAQPLAGAAARALYLQARVLWNRRTPDSIREAMGHLQRAIAIDGPFPLASAALADGFSLLMDYGIVSPKEGLTADRLAAGRALHHAPHLPESLTASALVRHMALDWKEAEADFRAAIRAHPGFAPARQRYALFLAGMGRYLESRREMGRALDLDPHTPAPGPARSSGPCRIGAGGPLPPGACKRFPPGAPMLRLLQ